MENRNRMENSNKDRVKFTCLPMDWTEKMLETWLTQNGFVVPRFTIKKGQMLGSFEVKLFEVFLSRKDARKMVRKLNKTEVDGTKINVEFITSEEDSAPSDGETSSEGSDHDVNNYSCSPNSFKIFDVDIDDDNK